MPYRRLPNTDAARLRALKIAYAKGKELPPFKLAFSQSSFNKVQSFITNFEHSLLLHRNAFNQQVQKNKDYLAILKRAKLYISHFIQVLNMAIARGEIPANVRPLYGFDVADSRVPLLGTEAEVIKWGENIIKGEYERLRKGQSPVSNPTIALVKVRFETFMDAYNHQKTLQKTHNRTLGELVKLRLEADEIIAAVWNDVEATYAAMPENLRREHSMEYGLIYVFRRNELGKLNVLSEALQDVTV